MIEDLSCGKTSCPCSHSGECDRGWIWVQWVDKREFTLRDGTIKVRETPYDGVRPCPICRPERAALFNQAQSPEELQRLLQGSRKPMTEERRTRIL